MVNRKKYIEEEIGEGKGIPPRGKSFSELMNIYKVVGHNDADNYAGGYDRKQSSGYKEGTADAYGIIGYCHATLAGAKVMLDGGWFGDSILQFKLLHGLENFIFYTNYSYGYSSDAAEVEALMRKTYGKVLSMEEQFYHITNDWNLSKDFARRYGSNPHAFGKHGIDELYEKGYWPRGIVCVYSAGDVVVLPSVFSDMITCAKAKSVRGRSLSEIQRELDANPVLDDNARAVQEDFLDIVPHMLRVGAKNPNACQYRRVGDYVFAPYDTVRGGYNIAIIDEKNAKPEVRKMFPEDNMLDQLPGNVTSSGSFKFIMGKRKWLGNVLGLDAYDTKLSNKPVFWLADVPDQPYEWDAVTYAYENPDWVESILREYGLVAETELHKKIMAEAFRPGMSYNDFVKENRAIGYVCTHSWSVNGILKYGFSREWASENDKKQRGGSWYGIGVYGSPILGEPFSYNNDMKNAGSIRLSTYPGSKSDGLKYGKVIFKCAILGGWNNFLIFDKTLAQAVYKDNWTIEGQIAQIFGAKNANDGNYLLNELKRKGVGHFRYDAYEDRGDPRTGEAIHGLFSSGVGSPEYEKWEKFFRQHGIRGAIYHGGNDGFAFVCYNFTEVIPIAVSYDNGNTFTDRPQTWSDRSGTYETSGIDWESTARRLQSGGDPVNKIGHLYKEVARIPKMVSCRGDEFGAVNVETKDGKFNIVRTDTWEPIFPMNLDMQPTISIGGKLKFAYRGYSFEGWAKAESADVPCVVVWDCEYGLDQLDAIIDYQGEESGGNEGDYEEQNDAIDNSQIQEQFFKTLDRIEGILHD